MPEGVFNLLTIRCTPVYGLLAVGLKSTTFQSQVLNSTSYVKAGLTSEKKSWAIHVFKLDIIVTAAITKGLTCKGAPTYMYIVDTNYILNIYSIQLQELSKYYGFFLSTHNSNWLNFFMNIDMLKYICYQSTILKRTKFYLCLPSKLYIGMIMWLYSFLFSCTALVTISRQKWLK